MFYFENPITSISFWITISLIIFIYLIYNRKLTHACVVFSILVILVILYIEESRLQKCRKECDN